ncbi:hypothetical protein [Methylorubrum extorquens]
MATSDRLWPWYLITGLYLAGCGIVLFDRGSEFGEFFKPADGSGSRLRLNEIGDIAAGIFAPLAFLWLFVATQLQRRELSLQRAELAETRAVLADQQRELQVSARESAHQTEIMRQTLDATNFRNIYDEFSTNLYYSAKIWHKLNGRVVEFFFNDGLTDRQYFFSFDNTTPLRLDDPTSIDTFFDYLHWEMMRYAGKVSEIKYVYVERDATDFKGNFDAGLAAIEGLVKSSKTSKNLMIRVRSDGIKLEQTLLSIKFFEKVIVTSNLTSRTRRTAMS